jgi:hypothetical protein
MKIKTMALAVVATSFAASAALAQTGTMQPIPNPPEKSSAAKHHAAKRKVKKPAAMATAPMPNGQSSAAPASTEPPKE